MKKTFGRWLSVVAIGFWLAMVTFCGGALAHFLCRLAVMGWNWVKL